MTRSELDVWVRDVYAGVLTTTDGNVDFAYAEDYQDNRRTPSLSVSMPKVRDAHGENVARRWIGNLLPDNDEVRERWAQHFDERRATAFNLLRHMGEDCAGAVQLLPRGQTPDDTSGEDPVSDDEVETRLRILRVDDSEWTFGDQGGRWSLGGAQGKFALSKLPDGTWTEPTGRAASTHIFKVGIHQFAHGDVAEFVTMRVADRVGLRVAHTEVCRFGDETALVSERYDRRRADDGTVSRVHQEDLCQAMGLSRAAKYEADGGPGVADIADLISRAVDPRDRPAARREFFAALVFNWAVAGTDAHAKNYSLLHVGSRVSMAPLYDLTSAAALLPPDEVEHRSKLAMKLGGHYKVQDIHVRHVIATGELLQLESSEAAQLARDIVAKLPRAIDAAIEEVGDLAPADVLDRFRDGMLARAAVAKRTLSY